MLIFAVVNQALIHNHHKNDPATRANMGVGIQGIDTKKEQAPHLSLIDESTQRHCFGLTCLFLLDLSAAWFDQYTKCFAGERRESVSTALESLLLDVFYSKFVFIAVSFLAELYMVGLYLR